MSKRDSDLYKRRQHLLNAQSQQEKRYPLTNDLLFKAVFGREEEQSKYLNVTIQPCNIKNIRRGISELISRLIFFMLYGV